MSPQYNPDTGNPLMVATGAPMLDCCCDDDTSDDPDVGKTGCQWWEDWVYFCCITCFDDGEVKPSDGHSVDGRTDTEADAGRGMYLGTWTEAYLGDWAADTAYAVCAKVKSGSQCWVCVRAHTSGNSFNEMESGVTTWAPSGEWFRLASINPAGGHLGKVVHAAVQPGVLFFQDCYSGACGYRYRRYGPIHLGGDLDDCPDASDVSQSTPAVDPECQSCGCCGDPDEDDVYPCKLLVDFSAHTTTFGGHAAAGPHTTFSEGEFALPLYECSWRWNGSGSPGSNTHMGPSFAWGDPALYSAHGGPDWVLIGVWYNKSFSSSLHGYREYVRLTIWNGTNTAAITKSYPPSGFGSSSICNIFTGTLWEDGDEYIRLELPE